ncbi:ankyrin repeat-containing domain protein [Pavlovales sp. CCMP2436]|nr:ankyrin repeat-containing domain protein [Pavlovales sp. CCMP2436]
MCLSAVARGRGLVMDLLDDLPRADRTVAANGRTCARLAHGTGTSETRKPVLQRVYEMNALRALIKRRRVEQPSALTADWEEHLADECFASDVVRVRHLLSMSGAQVLGPLPLRNAVRADSPSCVRALIAHGVDVNFADANTWTALQYACVWNREECAQLLIAGGADLDRTGCQHQATPLMIAIAWESCGCMRALLAAHADVNLPDAIGLTPITRVSSLEPLQLLCAHGAHRNDLLSRPFRLAILSPQVREWVLETLGWTSPLHHLEHLPPARVRQLLVGGADVHASDSSGNGAPTPLGLARALLTRDPAHECASLVVEAAAPWSRENHSLFPAHARARAAELLRLGQVLVREVRFAGKEGALLDVWPLVIAHALSRSE